MVGAEQNKYRKTPPHKTRTVTQHRCPKSTVFAVWASTGCSTRDNRPVSTEPYPPASTASKEAEDARPSTQDKLEPQQAAGVARLRFTGRGWPGATGSGKGGKATS